MEQSVQMCCAKCKKLLTFVNKEISNLPDHIQISYLQLLIKGDLVFPFFQTCSEQVCERAVLKADWFDEMAYFKVLAMPLIPQTYCTLLTYIRKQVQLKQWQYL